MFSFVRFAIMHYINETFVFYLQWYYYLFLSTAIIFLLFLWNPKLLDLSRVCRIKWNNIAIKNYFFKRILINVENIHVHFIINLILYTCVLNVLRKANKYIKSYGYELTPFSIAIFKSKIIRFIITQFGTWNTRCRFIKN